MIALEARERDLSRFLSQILTSDGCWKWIGSKLLTGYGSFTGCCKGIPKTYRAHRLSYLLKYGNIPDGKILDHLCRNRLCVNPDHLEPVTHQENSRRSNLVGKWKRSDTCKRGHRLEGYNAYMAPGKNGGKACRTCSVEHTKAWRAKRKLMVP